MNTNPASEYSVFENLGTSTRTIMVYCNVNFNIELLYKLLPITDVTVPLTKKKKLPDMKKIEAPDGTLISLRYKNSFRGIVTKPDIQYKQATYFLNQITCILSSEGKNIHIMVFKDKLKIAGCKSFEQGVDIVKVLWKHILLCKNNETHKIIDENPPTFIFDTVMTNVDFKLDFKIDRKKLNDLMNSNKYNELIHMSRFETTGNTNVNIKMKSSRLSTYFYKCLVYENDDFLMKNVNENKYNTKVTKKGKYTTFLVFRSSKVIESGRYFESMKGNYLDFINIIKSNKFLIEEKINASEDVYTHIV